MYDVFEVKLGDEFLMSSLFTVAEKELARLGLGRCRGTALDVIVGGLGLGYTTQDASQCNPILTLTVIDYSMRSSTGTSEICFPIRPAWLRRSRQLVGADFFAAAPDRRIRPERPGRTYDAILLDIDHSPRHLLHDPHGDLYTLDGLRRHPPTSPRAASSRCGPTIHQTTTSARFSKPSSPTSRPSRSGSTNPLTRGRSTATIYLATLP